jgi:hypothetical protein
MVEWYYPELITGRQCHERQYRVSHQNCNIGAVERVVRQKTAFLAGKLEYGAPKAAETGIFPGIDSHCAGDTASQSDLFGEKDMAIS